ncbi:MAG: bifunctional ornithine acetyltransferase/N-acetylglutamate synthase, partial [Myxococcota bacterium]|nr:bifunctional ornithine acetyltransferase/N-acetylglutamate synthase [Myxococcota bacterium]
MGQLVFSRAEPIATDLQALAQKLRGESRVPIDVRIGGGQHRAKVWGCDLSARYIEINSEYMT